MNDLDIDPKPGIPNVTALGLSYSIAPNLNVQIFSAGIMSAYVKCNSTGHLLHITHNIHLRNNPNQWTYVHYMPYSKPEGCAAAALEVVPDSQLFQWLGVTYRILVENKELEVQQAFKMVLQEVKAQELC